MPSSRIVTTLDVMAPSTHRTHHQVIEPTARSAVTRIAALAVVTAPLAAMLLSAMTASAGGSQGCPPPSAQYQSVQASAHTDDRCSIVVDAQAAVPPSVLAVPAVEQVIETPTGTTITED